MPRGAPFRTVREHRILRSLVAAVMGAALLFSGIPAPRNAAGDELSDAKAQQKALQTQIDRQQQLVTRLRRSQSALRVRLGLTTASLDATVSDLQAARRTISAVRDDIRAARADYARLLLEVDRLDSELRLAEAEELSKRADLRERQAVLAARIQAAYDATRRSPFEAVLSGASFTDLLNEASQQLDAGARDKELAEQIARDRETLTVLAATLKAQRSQADQLRQEAAVQKATLDARLADLRAAERQLKVLQQRTEAVLAEQRAAYKTLAQDQAHLRASIAATARAQQRLEGRIKRLVAEQASRGGIPSSFSGTMRWPMGGAVSQDYGCTGFPWEPTRGNCAHFHSGIDIVAPYGTPVRAAAAGRVVFVGFNPYDGPDPAWIVIIAHSSSVQTWYAHMQPRRPVKAGDMVEAGQVIGYEGSTGRSTGAHLDWRVMRNGEFVNPRLYL
ncbi:MAG: murein hydrolase activator EnvC family protein [Candidatus Limnocylindrales bacterium]